MEDRSRPWPLFLVLMGFSAAFIGAYTGFQVALLGLVDPKPGVDRAAELSSICGLWVLALLMSPLGAVPTALIASPAVLLLRHFNRTGWTSYALAGSSTALLILAAFTLPIFPFYPSRFSPGMWIGGVLTGASGALAFWVVLRPDRRVAAARRRPT